MVDVLYEHIHITKVLMCVIGQWPHQKSLEKIFIMLLFAPMIVAQAVLQGGGVIYALYAEDIDAAMEGFSPFIISLMVLCKYFNYIHKHNQMRKLLVTMEEDWSIYAKSVYEYDILHQSYAVAREITIAYAVSLYGTMTPFVMLPAAINVVGITRLYNITNDHPLTFRLEYFIDVETYYYVLLIHAIFGTLGYVTVVVAIDSMLVFHVQHDCAICGILRYRLEHLVQDDNLDINLNPYTQEDVPYEIAKNCVKIHKHIIQYATEIEEANTLFYLFQLGFNMIGISFTEYQAVAKLNQLNECIRFIGFAICLTSVLFVESWPGQQLKDYTEQIFENTANAKWYQSSFNARKLISVMLMRSLLPLKLTAGRIYVLDLENFTAVVRVSFSYFTVLSSLQRSFIN